MDWREREKKVLEYIQANPTCNKTEVKYSMPFAHRTTDKIIKKLIEEDEKVTFYIDKVNPRIHHLLINDKDKLAILNSRLRPMMTCAQLSDGRWACSPTPTPTNIAKARLPNVDPTVLDTVIKLLAGTKWHDNHPQIINLS
jgi:hypothetical protein